VNQPEGVVSSLGVLDSIRRGNAGHVWVFR
jgi:hypothetical protein